MPGSNEKICYKIDKKIIFSPIKETMVNIENLTERKLKTTEAKCLFLLLEKQGSVISQNELMAFAWGSKHREVSFNAFYQCILALRKTFTSLDASVSIITTLPRKGVMVDTTVQVEKVNDEEFIFKEPVEIPSTLATDNRSAPRLNVLTGFKHVEIFCLVITLLVSSYYLLSGPDENKYFSSYILAGKTPDNCQYYFDDFTDDYTMHASFLKQHPELCKKDKHLYLTIWGDSLAASVISCSFPEGKKQNNTCRSYYFPESKK